MESDSDFDGFEDRDIIETENRLLELNEGGSDFSDIEFSDLEEGDETESEDDQGPPPPPPPPIRPSRTGTCRRERCSGPQP